MSVLYLPNKILEMLDKLYRDFWRGDGEAKKNIQNIKYNHICKPVAEGGPGIRE